MTTVPSEARRGLWPTLALAALAISSLLPLLVLLLQSFGVSWRWPLLLPESYTTVAWRSIAGAALGSAALTSTMLALATAVASVTVALPIGRALATLRPPWRHVAAALVFLPVAAPPIALGAGLQVATLQLGLGGTFTAVWFAHCVPAIGYASLLFLGVFGARDGRDEEAAHTLGASRAQVWRLVLLPTLRGPIVDALTVCFLVSWAQVALTLVIGGGAVRALPIEVLALVRAGQDREAAVGALLLVVPAMLALSALRTGARRTAALPA
jgi:putative spermidine/putrescine transport system permease protein